MADAILPYSNQYSKKEYLKLFKKTSAWKNTNYVVLVAKYKFPNSTHKLDLIAFPFKMETPARTLFKGEIKDITETKHRMFAKFAWIKRTDGNLVAVITPIDGGLSPDYAETYGLALFAPHKIGVQVVGSTGKLPTNNESEEQQGQNISDDKQANKANKRAERLRKMQQRVSKIEGFIGQDLPITDIKEKIQFLKNEIAELKKDAPNASEKKAIVTAETELSTLENIVAKYPKTRQRLVNIKKLVALYNSL